MIILQNTKYLRNSARTFFSADEGVAPYVYTVETGGAGGVIGAESGEYIAPSALSDNPRESFDTIRVTDDAGNSLTTTINVLAIEGIVASIIQEEMELLDEQVVIQNQKIVRPNDNRLYASIVILDGKPFGNNRRYLSSETELMEVQSIVMRDMISINFMSASKTALSRRHEVMMALASTYSIQRQEENSFRISKVPLSITNISGVEGSRIPYGFNVTIAIQYGISKTKTIKYFDDFSEASLELIEP